MTIKAIDSESLHRLTSGQIVVDLSSAVKEALENSLDAHATVVEIKFKNYGLESFEVIDNGDGISPEDFDNIALRHHTSKLQQFKDLEKVATLGFRGEALNAISSIGELCMITRREQDVVATKLAFNRLGKVQERSTVTATKGTTVAVSNLFHWLPVRRKDLEKNIKRQFTRALSMIQSYAVISVGVRISVSNIAPNGKRTVQLLSGGKEIRQNLVNVFGATSVNGLMPLRLNLQWSGRYAFGNDDLTVNEVTIEGFISEPVFGKGRQSADRQLLYVNSRPCTLAKIAKAINEVYKQYNYVQCPVIIANLLMSPESYDVNVSPDKRTILLHQEALLIEELRSQLSIAFDDASHSVPKRHTLARHTDNSGVATGKIPSSFRFAQNSLSPASRSDGRQNTLRDGDISLRSVKTVVSLPSVISGREYPPKTPKESSSPPSAECAPLQPPLESEDDEDLPQDEPKKSPARRSPLQVEELSVGHSQLVEPGQDTQLEQNESGNDREEEDSDFKVKESSSASSNDRDKSSDVDHDCETSVGAPVPSTENSTVDEPRIEDTLDAIINVAESSMEDVCGQDDGHYEETGGAHDARTKQVPLNSLADDVKAAADISGHVKGLNNIYGTRARKHMTLNKTMRVAVDTSSIRDKWRKKKKLYSDYTKASRKLGVSAVNYADDAENIERGLNLIIRKPDFLRMRVIGQFNLGFILVMKPRDDGVDDLLIVDQHASDEKYNFERLQQDTVMKSQPLVVPRALNLSVVEELTLIKHVDLFKKNGFVVRVDENKPPGQQCTLISLPSSKTLVFDENDLHELIYLVSESPANSSVRCSKVRAMFAMRACRSSIMVGKPLSMSTMESVVKNLASLDKPWNCPHGRPTLRHITTIAEWVFYSEDL
jgi:DNA mismatch repair protein PMS2